MPPHPPRGEKQGNPQFLLQLSSKLPGQLPPKVSLEPCVLHSLRRSHTLMPA